METAHPFSMAPREVWEASKGVQAHPGAAGVEGQSIAACERDVPHHLSKLWNRMASGRDFPPPVRRVELATGEGRTSPWGLPTVADRLAQMVVKRYLEPEVETPFHPDSEGDRPGKSAMAAVGQARERWGRDDWVRDLDIHGFWANRAPERMMRAVRKPTDGPWGRWASARGLRAPVQRPDGTRVKRAKGTPQGGVGSPLRAHRCVHETGEGWRQRNQPDSPFARYAEAAVGHGQTAAPAQSLRQELEQRWAACRLARQPQQTTLVSGTDAERRGPSPHARVDFLG